MRILTDEQLLFLNSLKTDEYKELQRQAQEDLRLARIEAEAKQKAWLEADRLKTAANDAARKKVEAALREAGIKLQVEGYYDGTYLKAELPDGTKVELQEGGDINSFDEESE